MKITFHGGLCCGMKIIHGLEADPNNVMCAEVYLRPDNDSAENPDQRGQNVSSAQNFFYGEVPQETYLERFDRFVAYLDKVRPNGIIEVVLCDYSGQAYCMSYNQLPQWEPLLLERGFVLVTSCYNSNSKNRIFVYHRKTDKE